MKIVLVCPTYYGYAQSIGDALRGLGHDVLILDYFPHSTLREKVANRVIDEVLPKLAMGSMAKSRIARFNESVRDSAERASPDLVLVVKGEILEPDTVEAISARWQTVLWAPDDPYRFENMARSLRYYASVASFSKRDTERLREESLPAFWLPNGYAEGLFHGTSLLPLRSRRQASFVGARYPEREILLERVAGSLSLGIWGGDWRRRPWRARFYQPRKAVDRATMGWADLGRSASVYRSCKVNINIHGIGWDGLNTRLFEIPGAGGFQICDAREGIEEFFEIGTEIVTYESGEELLELAKYYVEHETDREKIRAAGQARAQREHGLSSRMMALLDHVR